MSREPWRWSHENRCRRCGAECERVTRRLGFDPENGRRLLVDYYRCPKAAWWRSGHTDAPIMHRMPDLHYLEGAAA